MPFISLSSAFDSDGKQLWSEEYETKNNWDIEELIRTHITPSMTVVLKLTFILILESFGES